MTEVVLGSKNIVMTFPSLDFKTSSLGWAGALSKSNNTLYSISLFLLLLHMRNKFVMKPAFKHSGIHPGICLLVRMNR